jgi:uncharacterized Zn finger protein (UPF0148 family)
MSSLKDKTYSYFQCPKCGSRKIQWIGNIIICLNCDYRDEAKNFEIELVRLEDAQKLEDRINYLDADRERMERLYSQALQKIVDLKNGHLELKQKLQQESMLKCKTSDCIHWENGDCSYGFAYRMHYCETYRRVSEKFWELLKEEKEAKSLEGAEGHGKNP